MALLCGCAHEPTRQPRAPGAQPALRMMTYNVNFGIPGDEPTLAAIERGDADVVFLQEINAAWERELRTRFAGRYRHLRSTLAAAPAASPSSRAGRSTSGSWFRPPATAGSRRCGS